MKKIFIADDEQDFVETVVFFLEQKGYTLFSACNGQEAISRIEKEKPDIILLDVMMPVKDGIAACRYLKSIDEYSSIPVIMLTAKGRREDIDEAMSAGADDYIIKPFDFDELIARIISHM